MVCGSAMTSGNIILLVLIGAAAFAVFIYNRLVALRQETKNAFADIDVQLKQRHDLIPNLVATVQGAAAHEAKTFQAVTEARAKAMRAGSVADKAQAEAALTGALLQLMAVAESYPVLRANENFKQLQSELSDLENKIAAARRFFNNAVAEYNTAIEQFPAVLFARTLGFKPADNFDLGEEMRGVVSEAPKVQF